MKAITLWQPWASLVACGAKTVETRSWSTSHRGLLAIHASAETSMLDLALEAPMKGALLGAEQDPARLPLGRIVAICFLAAVVLTSDPLPNLNPWDRKFGDFSPGRYAWFLAEIHTLQRPALASPKRGEGRRLWDWRSPRYGERPPSHPAFWTRGHRPDRP
jgi:hypothetical protein